MNNQQTSIRFHFLTTASLSSRTALKAFIKGLFKRFKIKAESLNIVFCSDSYLLNLNRQFLRHDFYTDILSFPLSKAGKPLIAEIYISIDRVKDNAKNLETPFREELHRVIFHGVLHFCGLKDKTAADARNMRSMEDKCLKRYFGR